VGVSPTFGPGALRVEIHVLGDPGELVGRRLAVAFLDRLRGEQVFSTVKELISQMHRDVEAARSYFESHPEFPPLDPLDGADLEIPNS
jgi:riboflavin kinase/FMN adenylyltransferase